MRNSKTKKMILNAILLGIGLILHQIFPAIGAGITPDLTLVMLFCIMIINKDDYKSCLIAGILTGVFTAMTTKFPMGQVPNFIDKLVTVNLMYVFMRGVYLLPLKARLNQVSIVLMSLVGTLVSGFTFLYTASVLVGLPGGLIQLFTIVVLPSALINTIAGLVLFNLISVSLKRTSYQIV